MTHKNIIIFWFWLLFTTFSCTDELELSPVSSMTVNSFWKTEEDAKGGLYGMYDRFRNQAAENLYYWGGARSEELSYGLQASEGRERFFENTLDANYAGPNWLRLYTVIHDANLIIKYVPEISFVNDDTQNIILAQAYAMRAYVYFVMVRTWGGVPLVTEPTEGYDPVTTFKPRASEEDIFIQIKNDIGQSLSLFPDNDFPSARSEWSAPAVNALKGEVFLWTAHRMNGGPGDFQIALDALSQVSNSDVSLLEDYDKVFRYDNKGNKEIIMAIHFEDLESGGNYNSSMFIRGDQIPVNTTEETKALLGIGGGLNRWAPSSLLRDQFSDDDSRKVTSFVEVYTYDGANNSTFYTSAVRKFRGFEDAGTTKFMDDVILYRYADILLMIAEAKNGLGQDPSTEINLVRQRAYGNDFANHEFVNGSQEENEEKILKERLFELSFEGKRWWDLVRFDKAFDIIPSLIAQKGNDHLLLFPISEATIGLNSKIIQNPGY